MDSIDDDSIGVDIYYTGWAVGDGDESVRPSNLRAPVADTFDGGPELMNFI
jgi:hypothetical protein